MAGKKKVLAGWVRKDFKRMMRWFPGNYNSYYLDTEITKNKYDKDDIKVRITIEEIK